LLEHEHVMIEELLQFLVGEVDAELLEAVVLRDIEDIEIITDFEGIFLRSARLQGFETPRESRFAFRDAQYTSLPVLLYRRKK